MMANVTNIAGQRFINRINAMKEQLEKVQVAAERIIEVNKAIRANFPVHYKVPDLRVVH